MVIIIVLLRIIILSRRIVHAFFKWVSTREKES